MKIKILGGGCTSCKKLYGNTKKSVTEMNISADVEYITDMENIMKIYLNTYLLCQLCH